MTSSVPTQSPRRAWWQEPLLWFGVIGVALFWIDALRGAGSDEYRIDITPMVQTRIADQWQAQMGRPPTAQELQNLVDQWVREEVYYREALSLGLDDADTIVRRRMVQKLTFLTEDVATAIEPDDEELATYYQNHAERYVQPPLITFSHRYFSADRRQNAQADATAALPSLAQLNVEADAPALGDPFMLQLSYVQRSQRQVADLFGREFAQSLFATTPGTWQGPIRSAYGWHLTKVDQLSASQAQPLTVVRDRVMADLLLSKREAANDAFYKSLLERYQLIKP